MHIFVSTKCDLLATKKKSHFHQNLRYEVLSSSDNLYTREIYKGACVVQWIEYSSHNPKVVGLSPVSMCCVPLSKELCPACLSPPWCKMRSCEENRPKTMRMPWAFV